MSLLDSNKRYQGSKSGKATIDLTSAGIQENISFGGSEFNTLKFIVSGITDGLDVILAVSGGIVENYTKINTYNEAGKLVSNITANGTYYAKCTGLTGVYFSVTRAASGTATVKWSLTTEGLTYQQSLNEIESKLDNQKVITPNAGVTLDLSSAGIKHTIQNENNFNCLVVNVSGMTSGTQAILDIVSTSSGYPKPSYLYNNFGEIFMSITKNGTYFVPLHELNGEIGIYCSRAGNNATATIKVELMKNFPISITQLKPIQTLINSDVEITSDSNVVLQPVNVYYENIPYKFFKYYFVQYSFKNGTSAVVRNSTIFAQPYYANNQIGKNTEIHNSTGDYATQSKWIEMNATYAIRFMISVPNYQSGDIVNFSVYGVR